MITSLQITLAVVGVLFVAAVIGYNLWQERKYRQEASRLFSSKREDILLGETVRRDRSDGGMVSPGQTTTATAQAMERAENPQATAQSPVVQTQPGPSATTREIPTAQSLHIALEGPLDIRDDEGLVVPNPAETLPAKPKSALTSEPDTRDHAGQAQTEMTRTEAGGFHAESGLDEAVEYVARVRFAKPAVTSYTNLVEELRRLGKPVRAMGRQPGLGWEPLVGHASQALEALEFGIQLADRNGAITLTQLDRFCKLLYDFAAAEGGAVSCPDKHAALEQARELDQFCMEVDVLIGLTVTARELRPFRGEDIHRLATEAGLTLGRDGAYHLLDAEGRTLFSLTNQEEQPFRDEGAGLTTTGVTLLFDVPRVRDGLVVFDRMTSLGLQMAEVLHGQLVDDNGRIVTRENLQKDRKRLAEYYARMASRGIVAGSDRALRLFV